MRKSKKIIFGVILILLAAIAGLFFFHPVKKKVITIENNLEPEIKSENTKGQARQAEEAGQAAPNDFNNVEIVKEGDKEDALENQNNKEKDKETTEDSNTKNRLVSWGFSSGRTQTIDTVIIHTVYNQLDKDCYNLDKILKIFKDYSVAPHYIIDRAGKVYQLVAEKNTAYHAGESAAPDGRTGVNNFSIGIEVINAENDEPEDAQYKSLKKLIGEIKSRHEIKYILGHSDVASGRKTDPWNFDWDKIGGKKK